MNYKLYIMAVLLISFGACKNSGDQNSDHKSHIGHQHDHNAESTHQHADGQDCSHDHDHDAEHQHETEEVHQHDHNVESTHQHADGQDCGHDHDADNQHETEEVHQHDHNVESTHQHADGQDCDHDHDADNQHEVAEAHMHAHGETHNHVTEPAKIMKSASPDGHGHSSTQTDDHSGHDHNAVKFQITTYNQNFEIFAEVDPFSTDQSAAILAHFTWVDNFKPLTKGIITASLEVDGIRVHDTQKQPLRDGIYRFNIQPKKAGNAFLIFTIETQEKEYTIEIPQIKIFEDTHDAIHWAEAQELSSVNTTVFTKEQSWKIEFETQLAVSKPFGKIIKTTALTQPCVAGEAIIVAKSNGIVDLQSHHITEGMQVKKGEKLFIISGNELANNNSSVRFIEAKNNYEKALSNYERAKELEKDKIVTTRELLEAKNEYENTKVIYENLQANFSSQGQIITSPTNGYINNLRVSNGEYVEAGYPLLGITKNQRLVLSADIQQKYAAVLPQIYTATIRTLHNNKSYQLEDLNGHILSYGKTTNSNNYLIPISLEIDNTVDFVSGGFVELYLKYRSNSKSIVIPKGALLEEQGNFFVFVQVHPELFEKREVTIGDTDGQYVEITSGLKDQERIVSRGAIMIKLAQSTGALDAHSGHVH